MRNIITTEEKQQILNTIVTIDRNQLNYVRKHFAK